MQEEIHFAHGKRTYTARLENLVVDLLDIATIKSVAEYCLTLNLVAHNYG